MSNIDQRRINNQRSGSPHEQQEFITAREAATLLDIKLPTLYAYVSRGLVRSMPGGRGRPRRYARADIDRLKARRDARRGHGAVAASALRWGEPVLDSSITEITASGHRYRGLSAVELAQTRTFEEVAELLWTGELPPPDATTWSERPDRATAGKLSSLVSDHTPSITALATLVTAMGARDPDRFAAGSGHATAQAEQSTARRILRTAPLALGGRQPVTSIAQALDIALSTRARSSQRAAGRRARALDQALVLLADHELNISAFAARVTASGGADLYACISAGLAALSGPRHGGMCERIEALAQACKRPDQAAQVIRDRMKRGEPVPGFGHLLYPAGDPRAHALLDTAARLGGKSRGLAIMDALARAMYRSTRQRPAVDFALVALTQTMRLRPGAASAVFAIGRIAGFIAHSFEQREAGFLLRPRARYVGHSATTEDALT